VSAEGEVLVGLVIVVGLVGVVVPVLPGSVLVWAAILVWALATKTTLGWVVLTAATISVGVAQVVKYVIPDRRLRAGGVPRRSIVLGGLLGLVGFFVLPVIGLVVGFLAGVYLSERQRLREHDAAWRATILAAKAAGVSVLVELAGGLLAATVWLSVATTT
jgi:uncharacterized protein